MTSVVPGTSEWAQEPERRNWLPYVLIGAIVLALLVAGGFMLKDVLKKGPEEVSLPRVTQIKLEEAKTKITGAGLVVGTVTEEFSDSVAAGLVISQDPDPATDGFVAPDTEVNLVVSKGEAPPDTKVIPDVAGLNKDDAATQLRALGFNVAFKSVKQTSDERLDEVVGTTPAIGKTVEVGKTVTIRYSEGPPPVPDVTGLSEADAKKILNNAGFKDITVIPDATSTEPAGTVTYQSLPAGQKQDVKTPITIQVSTYVEPPPPTSTPTDDPTLLP